MHIPALLPLPSSPPEVRPQPAPRRPRLRLPAGGSAFELHNRHSARRPQLEAYIATVFADVYGAAVTQFAPLLLELGCESRIAGVAGIRLAGAEPLFLEVYLDRPVEAEVSALTGAPVSRHQIVEIANLAAMRSGACQLINLMLALVLRDAGLRYACFAGTSLLGRIVRKQQFAVQSLGTADPARLGPRADDWGTYYDTAPDVLLVDLAATRAELERQRIAGAMSAHYAATMRALSVGILAYNSPGA